MNEPHKLRSGYDLAFRVCRQRRQKLAFAHRFAASVQSETAQGIADTTEPQTT